MQKYIHSVPQTEMLANILSQNFTLLHDWIQKQERVPHRGNFKLQGWTKTEENDSQSFQRWYMVLGTWVKAVGRLTSQQAREPDLNFLDIIRINEGMTYPPPEAAWKLAVHRRPRVEKE